MPDPAQFSGRLLLRGSRGEDVRALQRRLNRLGCGPVDTDGVFGPQTEEAVRLFQSRATDGADAALATDGQVGALTWAALFGPGTIRAPRPRPGLAAEVVRVATGEVGTMEVPPGSNRGPRVDAYLRSVGLDPARGSYPWCTAFVYWCFAEAARSQDARNPAARTGGVLESWRLAGASGARLLTASRAHLDESLVRPGHVFVIDTGGGRGHTGVVAGSAGGLLRTIEGNTNESGGREGVGVFARSRHLRGINVGFIDYFA